MALAMQEIDKIMDDLTSVARGHSCSTCRVQFILRPPKADVSPSECFNDALELDNDPEGAICV